MTWPSYSLLCYLLPFLDFIHIYSHASILHVILLHSTGSHFLFEICNTTLDFLSSGTQPSLTIPLHTQPFYCSSGICPGPPRWAGTRKVKPGRLKPIRIYWSKRQWVAVASAGLYASLHLIPDNHTNIPPLSFLQAGCSSCRPTNSVKALKAMKHYHYVNQYPLSSNIACGLYHFCY